jgi:hypothetical protein
VNIQPLVTAGKTENKSMTFTGASMASHNVPARLP